MNIERTESYMKLDSSYRISAPLKIYLTMNNTTGEQRRMLQEAEHHYANYKRKRLIKPVRDAGSESE
jgi:hypothetical protein